MNVKLKTLILNIVFIGGAVFVCGYVFARTTPPDNKIEQAIESIIQAKIGVHADLSPEVEKKKQ